MIGWVIYRLLHICIGAMIQLGLWRWRVVGLEHLPPRRAGGLLIAMNHINWLDILALGAVLPPTYRLWWLGKIELFDDQVSNWFFATMQTIPVRRGKRDLAALNASFDVLRQGGVLVIFPEGTRSRDGILRAGQAGAARLAVQAGVPIVPIGITGTERSARDIILRRGEIVVQIGRSYTIDPDVALNGRIHPRIMRTLTTDMMQRIAALLPPNQRGDYAAAVAQPEYVGVSTF